MFKADYQLLSDESSENKNKNKNENVEFDNSIKGFQKRYKSLYDEKELENDKIETELIERLNFRYIKDNFSKKIIDIINHF